MRTNSSFSFRWPDIRANLNGYIDAEIVSGSVKVFSSPEKALYQIKKQKAAFKRNETNVNWVFIL